MNLRPRWRPGPSAPNDPGSARPHTAATPPAPEAAADRTALRRARTVRHLPRERRSSTLPSRFRRPARRPAWDSPARRSRRWSTRARPGLLDLLLDFCWIGHGQRSPVNAAVVALHQSRSRAAGQSACARGFTPATASIFSSDLRRQRLDRLAQGQPADASRREGVASPRPVRDAVLPSRAAPTQGLADKELTLSKHRLGSLTKCSQSPPPRRSGTRSESSAARRSQKCRRPPSDPGLPQVRKPLHQPTGDIAGQRVHQGPRFAFPQQALHQVHVRRLARAASSTRSITAALGARRSAPPTAPPQAVARRPAPAPMLTAGAAHGPRGSGTEAPTKFRNSSDTPSTGRALGRSVRSQRRSMSTRARQAPLCCSACRSACGESRTGSGGAARTRNVRSRLTAMAEPPPRALLQAAPRAPVADDRPRTGDAGAAAGEVDD